MFAIDVKDWAVDQPIKLADGPNLISFPAPLSKLKPGKYAAQALMRVNMTTHRLGNGPGNAFSDVVQMEVAENQDVTVKMAITATQPEDTFPEHPRVKLETLESPLLSAFYGRPVRHRASIVLPEGRNAKTALPSIYIIPGFGGDHRQGLRMAGRSGGMNFGSDMVRIVLDPDCVTGHHVFADSATNGPRGKALVEALARNAAFKVPFSADALSEILRKTRIEEKLDLNIDHLQCLKASATPPEVEWIHNGRDRTSG
jgi:hypothetical protein